ncbi:hypothetical protein J6590_014436 [Homalodisca vitripennis]|nr:hypothetical protein J6590_014436 [Homalodisca vitripennis]
MLRNPTQDSAPYGRQSFKAEVQFVQLSNSIKNAAMPKAFEHCLKPALISKAFYNIDECMTHVWDTT